jgi:uncharacterized membrane protein
MEDHAFLLRLTVSGACHRPAPSEGQKENKWKNKPFHNKMEVKRKMAKNSKLKHLIAVILVIAILAFSAYAALTPSAYAAEATLEEKGLSILSNVVGIDTAKYTVTTEQQQDNSLAYLDVVPQETVSYDLTSENSKVKVLYTFTDENVQMIHVLEREGPPSLVKPATFANDVELAEAFLSNYQTYTANPLFGELKSTLIDVVPGKNLTKTSGNIVLEATANDGYTYFKWYYTANGAAAPYSKFITLSFKDGFLEIFADNWQLYNIGSTNINLSEEEAITIALETAKAHFWSLNLEADALDVNNFNESNVRWTSLIFDNSLNANETRSEDLLELYPVRRIGIALNKWYGHMYGTEVDIWADTKKVRSVQEVWSTLPPPEGEPTANINILGELTNQTSFWIGLPSVLAVATGTALVCLLTKKSLNSSKLLKRRFSKTGGVLLCVLIMSVLLLTPTATVKATTRAGVVWGSESNAAINPITNESWRKSQTEIHWQKNTAGNISQWFGANGYNGINHQGNLGSTKSQIMIDLSNLYSYDYLAVVIRRFSHLLMNSITCSKILMAPFGALRLPL